MRQFDIYRNPSPEAREIAPFLVVLSSHLLRDLSNVVMAPAVNDASAFAGDLEIPLIIQGQPLSLVVGELFSLASASLRRRIGSAAEHEDAIRRALDRLFTGF